MSNDTLNKMAENARELGLDYEPAQQEPVAVPTTSYEHRKFVLVGRKWYERFAAFHDDCQIGERLTREEQTVRQQGYENGWNDAQRYLREPQASPPTQPQQEPVVIHQFRSPHCSDWYDGVPDHHDGYGPYEVRTLYTSPPAQRTWVGLTDEERFAIADEYQSSAAAALMVEAKLKEKNNG